jgi:DNA recombination protein RmuC
LEPLIFGALVVLIALVGWLLLQRRSGSADELKASLRLEFLDLQSRLSTELGTARQSMDGAKDTVAGQAIQTIARLREVGETLQKLIQQQEEAQKLGQGLKDLLQAPKLRGNYGEAILEELLSRTLPLGIWERQYAIDGGTTEHVDCVVRIRDVVVPIDAKFPRDDYMRYIEADSDVEKAQHWKAFEGAVKTQITSIKKKYIKPELGTTEFALMFIPSEAVYYETIAESNYLGHPSAIWKYAQDNQVVPVSPNTFYAFLQVVILSIKNVEIISKAKELREGLASLETSFGYFYKQYQDMGKEIEKAAEAYRVGNGHIDRFKRRLDSTLKLETLQEGDVLSLPPESKLDDQAAS